MYTVHSTRSGEVWGGVICTHTYVCTCIHIHTDKHRNVRTCRHMHIHACIPTHTHIHTHTHIYIYSYDLHRSTHSLNSLQSHPHFCDRNVGVGHRSHQNFSRSSPVRPDTPMGGAHRHMPTTAPSVRQCDRTHQMRKLPSPKFKSLRSDRRAGHHREAGSARLLSAERPRSTDPTVGSGNGAALGLARGRLAGSCRTHPTAGAALGPRTCRYQDRRFF